jgi:hypothetical protein
VSAVTVPVIVTIVSLRHASERPLS